MFGKEKRVKRGRKLHDLIKIFEMCWKYRKELIQAFFLSSKINFFNLIYSLRPRIISMQNFIFSMQMIRVRKWKNASKRLIQFLFVWNEKLEKSKNRFKRRFLNDSGERRYQHVQTKSMISANKKIAWRVTRWRKIVT